MEFYTHKKCVIRFIHVIGFNLHFFALLNTTITIFLKEMRQFIKLLKSLLQQ